MGVLCKWTASRRSCSAAMNAVMRNVTSGLARGQYIPMAHTLLSRARALSTRNFDTRLAATRTHTALRLHVPSSCKRDTYLTRIPPMWTVHTYAHTHTSVSFIQFLCKPSQEEQGVLHVQHCTTHNSWYSTPSRRSASLAKVLPPTWMRAAIVRLAVAWASERRVIKRSHICAVSKRSHAPCDASQAGERKKRRKREKEGKQKHSGPEQREASTDHHRIPW